MAEPPGANKRGRFSEEGVRELAGRFILEANELTAKEWDKWAAKRSGPSNGVASKYLGGPSFSVAITRFASETASPDRVLVWPICPNGLRHQPHEYFEGTAAAHAAGPCGKCTAQANRREEWLADQSTFQELYPDLVPFLADPANAVSKAKMVEFRCWLCGHTPIRWSPRWDGLPLCGHCRLHGDIEPGSIVERRGGGTAVRLEAELAAALIEMEVAATADFGVAVPPHVYRVGIIKPDVLLVGEAIAIEIDNHPHPANRHHTSEGADDDRLRDEVLQTVGWRVLRIRRPDAPTSRDWPWRIETTSQTSIKLAKLIADHLLAQHQFDKR